MVINIIVIRRGIKLQRDFIRLIQAKDELFLKDRGDY